MSHTWVLLKVRPAPAMDATLSAFLLGIAIRAEHCGTTQISCCTVATQPIKTLTTNDLMVEKA